MADIEVTISIVTYNSESVLLKCIESVLKSTQHMAVEVIVVDNCSRDDSVALVRAHFSKVRLVQNRENVGFGRAHNHSFRLSKGKYFLILNPDTVVFPNAIQRMVTFMEKNEGVGVVGCKTFWDDNRDFIFPDLRIHTLRTALLQFTSFCRFFPNSVISKWYWKSAYRTWNTAVPIPVEGIPGGLMMVRREAFETAGCFDENFFLFFEEHDLFRRMKRKGWHIYYVPDAEIQHYFEESVRNSPVDIASIFEQSALYYYRKYYSFLGCLFIRSLLTLNRSLRGLTSHILDTENGCSAVRPIDGKLLIEWSPYKEAERYLVEICYGRTFCDRAGMYVKGESLTLISSVLERLPNKTGFIRILPVFSDNSTGKVLKIAKITA
jgi:GT2 family glycosyltransferase